MKKIFLAFSALMSISLSAQTVPFDAASSLSVSTDTIFIEPVHTNNPTANSNLWPAPYMQERLLFWIHGLGGSNKSWGALAAATQLGGAPGYPARKVTSINKEYAEYGSLNTAVVDLANQYHLHTVMPPFDTVPRYRHMAIAHSQGGLVARKMDQQFRRGNLDQYFGALITFGTPHKGAKVLNNSNPSGNTNMVGPWLNNGCVAFGHAYLTNLLKTNFWTSILVSSQTLQQLTSQTCNSLENTLLPVLVKDFLKPITHDYRVGADTLANLNANPGNLPTVAVYGVEKRPVLWRTVGSLTIDDTLVSHSLFGNNNDDVWVNTVNAMIADYTSNVHFANSQYDIWISIPLFQNVAYRWWDVRNANKAARDWLRNADRQWERIIGSRYDSIYQDGYICRCVDEASPGLNTSFSLVQNPSDCNAQNPTQICSISNNIVTLPIQKPSDGVVLAESAKGLGSFTKIYNMPQTNHQQMRNSAKTIETFNKIFNNIQQEPDLYPFELPTR